MEFHNRPIPAFNSYNMKYMNRLIPVSIIYTLL